MGLVSDDVPLQWCLAMVLDPRLRLQNCSPAFRFRHLTASHSRLVILLMFSC